MVAINEVNGAKLNGKHATNVNENDNEQKENSNRGNIMKQELRQEG